MLLSLLLVAFQGPVIQPLPIVPVGIEAPTQPTGTSSSTIARGPRIPGYQAPIRTGILVRVSDVMRVRGQEANVLQGFGLITGLAGTGDSGGLVKDALRNLLQNVNVQTTVDQLQSKNMAIVWVEASMPSGLKAGTPIDVKVSAIGDAISLNGGNLVSTELIGMDGSVYATASGSIQTNAYSIQAEGASATSNHPTVGTISGGGKVERSVQSMFVTEHGYIYLDSQFRKGSFGNSGRVAAAINELYPGIAVPLDEATVRVHVPTDIPQEQYVPFLDTLLSRELESEAFARVVVNERTGVIVIGEGVRISAGAVTKGNLTVTIAESPEATQPGPLSGGSTETLPRTSLTVQEENRALSVIRGAANLNEVVEVLDVLGVSPRDMIQLLSSMSQAGMLHAELIQL